MGTSGGSSPVLDVLEAAVCTDPAVEFAVAFGSQITGKSTRASDLDLAVKFADTLSDHERFGKRCYLSGALQQEDTPFIDISDIEALPLDVVHDAVHGRFVCGDEQAFEQFKADIETACDEQGDTLRRQQRDVIDRIAEDGLRG